MKKYINLNASIEKAVKQYSKDVKTKIFPKNKNFYMENEIENKSSIIHKLNLLIKKKNNIISFFIIIIIIFTAGIIIF